MDTSGIDLLNLYAKTKIRQILKICFDYTISKRMPK